MYWINVHGQSVFKAVDPAVDWRSSWKMDHIVASMWPDKLQNWYIVHDVTKHISFISMFHYDDVIMSSMASQITSLTIIYSTVYSGTDHQRKHPRSASLAFVRGIHRGTVNSPHKWPVTRKMFLFDDVIMRLVGFLFIDIRAIIASLPAPVRDASITKSVLD